MRFYRFIHEKHKENVLGFGMKKDGSFYPGRWNSHRFPAIYASSHLSLAQLEMLSILGTKVIRRNWLIISFDIKKEPDYFNLNDLPKNWSQNPRPKSTQRVGDYFLKNKDSLAVKIPSSRLSSKIYPNEFNILINPLFDSYEEHLINPEIWEGEFFIKELKEN